MGAKTNGFSFRYQTLKLWIRVDLEDNFYYTHMLQFQKLISYLVHSYFNHAFLQMTHFLNIKLVESNDAGDG